MRWEYLLLKVRLVEAGMLNEHGAQGWELVSDIADSNTAQTTLVFKRPVKE